MSNNTPEDPSTKQSSFKQEERNPDLELQSFDLKSQDNTELLSYRQNPLNNRHFGNNLVCWFRKNEPTLTLGPHWYVAMIMIALFCGGGIYMANSIAIHKSTTIYILTYVVTFTQTFFYLMVSLMNPGISSTGQIFDEKTMIKENRCNACRVKKSDYVVHCLDCDICIRGFDHHCPWVGKCIGEWNQKWFNLFILSTLIYIIYSSFMVMGSI